MKVNKFKLIIVIIIFIFIIVGVYSYRHDKQTKDAMHPTHASQKVNKKQTTKKEKELKTVVDRSDSQMKQIDQYLEEGQFNGTVTVFKKGQLSLNKGYGFKDFEKNETNTANTMFLIGSAQKFMTGLMLKQLETEGEISMVAPVKQYLPYFELAYPVALKQLMLHQSGLYKYQAHPKLKTLDEAIHAIIKRGINPLYYNQYQYNDANYLVLSEVIEAVTYQSYTQNLNDRIVKPYNLKYTGRYNDSNFKKYMATGYKKDKSTGKCVKQNPNTLSQYDGAGNLYMTPYDMGKVVLNLQKNKIFNATITRPFIHESLTIQYPQAYRYGFYSFADKNRINGIFYGNIFTVYFNDNYIIVLATNYENGKTSNEQKMKHIYFDILQQGGSYNKVKQPY